MGVKKSIQGSLFLLLLLFSWAYLFAAPAPEPEPTLPDPVPQEQERSPTGLVDHQLLLRVLLGDQVQMLPMDEYLTGVLRAEMPAAFETEALKAQVVAARSYTLHKVNQGEIDKHPQADACDNISCCKAYATAQQAAEGWGEDAALYEQKLQQAVSETDGLVAVYQGSPILAVFHSSAPGYTQNAQEVWQSDVPYLKSVQSPEGESSVPHYYSSAHFDPEQARQRLLAARPQIVLGENPAEWIGTVERNGQGLVTSVDIGSECFTGGELRNLFDLRSACFELKGSEQGLAFSVTAYGHGVGMSQYGANELAQQGLDYQQILAWYYTGITVEPYQAP